VTGTARVPQFTTNFNQLIFALQGHQSSDGLKTKWHSFTGAQKFKATLAERHRDPAFMTDRLFAFICGKLDNRSI
jgi:hypothetical protein